MRHADKADSAAEASGLKDAFTRACSDAWSRVGSGERDLTPVYAEFLADASRAFEKAELRKGHKQDAAATKGDRSASDERLVETVVLRAYKHHCVTAAEASRRFPVAQFAT